MGQTGCGKTFTMMGIVNDPNLRAVIPNAFEHFFLVLFKVKILLKDF